MKEKDRKIIEAVTIAITLLILVPTVIEACPDGHYPSIVEWWDKGNAQLTLACRDALDPRSRFWGDDVIGNFFGNYSRWVAGYAVAGWNALVTSWYGKLLLIVIGAILSNFIYDLLKYLIRKIFHSAPDAKASDPKA
ncbi:MAG: hypothetical protein HY231_16180 [Acidobacteria bacterium]|nr:hypothetical protein [Acidobacteriota bacterium]